MELGALNQVSCVGAQSGNANKGWSLERWASVERGAVNSNSLGAWSGDAKTGRSVERWRPPNGPQYRQAFLMSYQEVISIPNLVLI